METSLLGEHLGQAHRLAIVPGSPHIFYSCGEDGLVQLVSLKFPLTCFICSLCKCHIFLRDLEAY